MIAFAPGTALAVPAYTITDLGTLGGSYSIGTGINSSGQVTEPVPTVDSLSHAFLWNPTTGMKDLGTLGGSYSIGTGINASGRVAGTSFTGTTDSMRSYGTRWPA